MLWVMQGETTYWCVHSAYVGHGLLKDISCICVISFLLSFSYRFETRSIHPKKGIPNACIARKPRHETPPSKPAPEINDWIGKLFASRTEGNGISCFYSHVLHCVYYMFVIVFFDSTQCPHDHPTTSSVSTSCRACRGSTAGPRNCGGPKRSRRMRQLELNGMT